MADQGEKSLTHPTHRVGKIILDYLDIHSSFAHFFWAISNYSPHLSPKKRLVFGWLPHSGRRLPSAPAKIWKSHSN
jgi:hypothetical protein